MARVPVLEIPPENYGGKVVDTDPPEDGYVTHLLMFNSWNERERYIGAVESAEIQEIGFARGMNNVRQLWVYERV